MPSPSHPPPPHTSVLLDVDVNSLLCSLSSIHGLWRREEEGAARGRRPVLAASPSGCVRGLLGAGTCAAFYLLLHSGIHTTHARSELPGIGAARRTCGRFCVSAWHSKRRISTPYWKADLICLLDNRTPVADTQIWLRSYGLPLWYVSTGMREGI
jgi:hypothetical protein